MSLKNTEHSYGWISIALHWLIAIVVFGMFGLGLYMVELTYYDAWYKGSLDLHKGAGILLAIAVAGRFFWRSTSLAMCCTMIMTGTSGTGSVLSSSDVARWCESC